MRTSASRSATTATPRCISCRRSCAKWGTPHEAIIAHRVTHGLLTGARDDEAVRRKLSACLELPASAKSSRIDELADGRLICVTRDPLDGGGWVATHEDITEQKARRGGAQSRQEISRYGDRESSRCRSWSGSGAHKFILANRAYETFIGLAARKLSASTSQDLFSTRAADLIAELDTEALHSTERTVTSELQLDSAGNRFTHLHDNQAGRARGERQAAVSDRGS